MAAIVASERRTRSGAGAFSSTAPKSKTCTPALIARFRSVASNSARGTL